MTIRSQVRLAFVAVALLAGAWLSNGGLAQDSNQQADPDKPSSAKPSGPSYLEPLNSGETVGVLGKSVVARNGEGLGLITDVIVDRTGQPRAAVIDFGGFLGVGSRKIAVDWNLLSFDPEKRDRAVLALRRHEIRAAPEYRGDATSAEMVGPPLVGSSSGDAGK
jgi:PRC-barrel domain